MNRNFKKSAYSIVAVCILSLMAVLLNGCVSPPTGAALQTEIQRISGSWVGQWAGQNDISHWDAGAIYYFMPDGTGKAETRAFGFMVPGAKTYDNEVGEGPYRANTSMAFKWKCVGPGVFDIRVTSKSTAKYWRTLDHVKYKIDADGAIHDSEITLRKTTVSYDAKGLAAAEKLASLHASVWLTTSASSFVANYNGTQGSQGNDNNGAEIFSALAMGLSQAAPIIQQGIQNQQMARAGNATGILNSMASANLLNQAMANNTTNTTGGSNPDCLQCLQSRAYLTWKSRCENNMTAQAACYCAAATLIRCQIDKGGCGNTIQALRTAYQQNVQQASQLGTRCFTN